MADLGGVFDARTVEPGAGMKPVPAGKYKAVIRRSEKKQNSKKTGHMIELTLEIVQGEYQGKRIMTWLNLWNPSTVAVEIARGELSAICHATGVMNLTDTQQLHDIPLLINVKVKERSDKKGEYNNEIDSYERTDASQTPQPAMASNGSDADEAPWT